MIYTINLQQKGGRKAKGLEKKENDKNKKKKKESQDSRERERDDLIWDIIHHHN